MEEIQIIKLRTVKEYVKNSLDENLQNFELVDGGQQRTVGDLIESKVVEILYNSNDILISEKKRARSKKSIEDVTIIHENIKFYIDPKTHDINSDFSMPNLTSIEKIKKLFISDEFELIYVFVNYHIENGMVIINNIKVFYIWELDTSILTVGALGKGQLQIKNANEEFVFTDEGKIEWYSNFKKLVQVFLKKQINKVQKQISDWE